MLCTSDQVSTFSEKILFSWIVTLNLSLSHAPSHSLPQQTELGHSQFGCPQPAVAMFPADEWRNQSPPVLWLAQLWHQARAVVMHARTGGGGEVRGTRRRAYRRYQTLDVAGRLSAQRPAAIAEPSYTTSHFSDSAPVIHHQPLLRLGRASVPKFVALDGKRHPNENNFPLTPPLFQSNFSLPNR